MSAIRKVETFVAKGKIRNSLVPEGQGQGAPIMEGGIRDLVTDEIPLLPRDGDVANLASPTLGQGNHEVPRPEGTPRFFFFRGRQGV